MAPFSPGAFQEGRWRALLWSVCACRGLAADLEFHAQEIWRTDFWSRGADRARAEIIYLPGADALERDRRRDLSRAGRAGHGVFGRTFARDDDRARGRDAESSRETRLRESGRTAQHAGRFAPDDETDAAFHPT